MGERLKDRVAVVTGGGGGIGRNVSLGLSAQGAAIVVSDLGIWTPGTARGSTAADMTVDAVNTRGGRAVACYDDISTMAGGESVVKTAIDSFGRLDIVVCCAGNILGSGIEGTSEEDWDKVMGVHAKGHFTVIKSAVPYLKQSGAGRIITISSTAAFGGRRSAPAYAAAKSAILGLTRSLALELGRYGITANAVLPSAITQLFPHERKVGVGGIPPANPPGPEAVAPFIVYLSTDDAKDINGQFFYAGGGDVALYEQARPGQMLHKPAAMWTVEELVEIVPNTFGINLTNPSPRQA
ncbi:MAG: SDR family oxidoreductase [Chloroflexi bacterium]|nr:SDR family oxidoreductase [Chloroflexota bacterium]